MDDKYLVRLLSGEHFNMEKRKEYGLSSSEMLRFDEVLDLLANILENTDWFPKKYPTNENGAHEGVIVQKVSSEEYICHCSRSHPINPSIIAEQAQKRFSTPHDAAAFYLKWALHLPGKLDSWKVV